MHRRPALVALSCAATLIAALASIPAHAGTPAAPDFTIPAARETDPVVLTGKDLLAGGSVWSVPENLSAAVPSKDATCFVENQGVECPDQYNHYVDPDADTSTATAGQLEGTPTDKILGYRWDGSKFVQIPFQVDEVFTRYLNNDASGFGVYSGTDKHTTYAYDREGFRFTENGRTNGCWATMKPGDHAATDPVKGLDTNDELAFMASDAGPQAPAGAPLPQGIDGRQGGDDRSTRRTRARRPATSTSCARAPTGPSRRSTLPAATSITSATTTPTSWPTRSRATAATGPPNRARTARPTASRSSTPTAPARSGRDASSTAPRSPPPATSTATTAAG